MPQLTRKEVKKRREEYEKRRLEGHKKKLEGDPDYKRKFEEYTKQLVEERLAYERYRYREEHCHIKMRAKTPDLKEALKALSSQHLEDEDTVTIDYSFILHYRSVAEQLRVIIEICDHPDTIIVEANCQLLEEEKCLIYEILKRLDSVIKIVKEKE